ncbi:DUF7093 family protein [Halosolutus gelatinilyticus]|uniref:DUF7093 family protein n=1 Tax=Halosolutus gelatinilyticus TaxID=2931975 RepID=UPI001FF3DD62|nr:hypothetical protein [Halosolutus gelatinilyticus]
MVLRCSLLGHDYGDPDVDREREERGSEVVVTVQEYEECARCGQRHVISENTEVTSLTTETAADPRPDEPEADADDAASTPDAEPTDSAADDIDIPTDENGDPITDDAEILEDEEPTPDRDREHGEWPDSEDVGPPVGADTEPAAWPDADDEQSVDDETEPAAWPDADEEPIDDAVLLETDATAEAERGDGASIGLDAEPPETGAIEAEPSAADPEGLGIERATSAPAPAEGRDSPDDDVPMELYCPRCDYIAGNVRTSLRTGDICPECRKGYLGERER